MALGDFTAWAHGHSRGSSFLVLHWKWLCHPHSSPTSPSSSQSHKMPGEGAEAGGFAATVMVEKSKEAGTLELEVPDTIIGAVLGPKARTLGEIQQHSGCKVQVHKRMSADTTAGTRLISLSGEDSSIQQARELIERVINEEQSRRLLGGMPHPKAY